MRPLRVEDRALYIDCYTDPLLMHHIGAPLSTDAALRSFNAALKMNSDLPMNRRIWVMRAAQLQADIGLLALVCDQTEAIPAAADIGAIILAEFHNKGFAAEAIGELVNVAFANTTMDVLRTHHDERNASANGLMEKLGFHRNHSPANLAACEWLLLRSDWQTLQSQ